VSEVKTLKTVIHSEPAINKLYRGRVTEEKHENQCAVVTVAVTVAVAVAVAVAAVDTLPVFVRRW
jgi:hypothetical protein